MKRNGLINEADQLLYDYGLLQALNQIGTPYIIGSYKMDLMVARDLDIDITNENMSLDQLYQLTDYIIKTFKPTWYEAKEAVDDQGKKIWFHGFETMLLGELWNVDLWFFDSPTIMKALSQCDDVIDKVAKNNHYKDRILSIKRDLIDQGLYFSNPHNGMDVYDAVINKGVTCLQEFIENHRLEQAKKG